MPADNIENLTNELENPYDLTDGQGETSFALGTIATLVSAPLHFAFATEAGNMAERYCHQATNWSNNIINGVESTAAFAGGLTTAGITFFGTAAVVLAACKLYNVATK